MNALIARIRVDSSGVDSALLNLSQSFGKANLQIAAAGAGIGIAVLAGKSMIDISEKWQSSQLDLAQAVEAHNAALGKVSTSTIDLTKLTAAHEAAVTALERVELGMPSKHAATALQLFNLSEAQKKATETANALAAAQASNAALVTGTKINLTDYQLQIEAFIATNRKYISDQSEVVDGYAKLIREGVSVAQTNKDMATALDIAAVQGISLTDAVTLLQSAESGRTLGLKKMVGMTLESIPPTATLAEKQAIVAHNMDLVAAAYKHGADTLTPLQQANNDLSNTWQTIAEKRGPALITELTNVVNYTNDHLIPSFQQTADTMDGIGKALDRLASHPSWQNLYALFSNWNVVIPGGPLDRLLHWLEGPQGGGGTLGIKGPTPLPGAPGSYKGGQASGGPVLPNSVYTVGEKGPETLVMGGTGGTIIPNGGSGSGSSSGRPIIVNLTVMGSVQTERSLALALRESIRRIDREQR